MVVSNIPKIKIGNIEVALIQGGMGVGISLSGLASAVINEGGLGVIASVGAGEAKGYIKQHPYAEANRIALREEIQEVRRKSKGFLGVNVMTALTDAQTLIETALEENVDVIISGAGIKKDLPKYLKGSKTLLVPIVSSARVAEFICEKAWGPLGHLPDAIIVEGPMAGGHLGYDRFNTKKPDRSDNLDNPDFVEHGLEGIVKAVIDIVKKYETTAKKMPVIAAGGIFYGGDIRRAVEEWGAAGVQMATRFVTTYECDADIRFKQAYVDCKKEDLVIINSPVGMPGRAIKNAFLERVIRGETTPVTCPYHCLITCKPKESPYCIARALVDARRGEFENGYVFAGANAFRCNEIVSVHDVFLALDQEYASNKRCD